jgi:superfamily II DNA helicase RecQ
MKSTELDDRADRKESKAGRKRAKSCAESSSRHPDGLHVEEIFKIDFEPDDDVEGDNDDDDSAFLLSGNAKEAGDIPPIIPQEHIKALMDILKKLALFWAEEERLTDGNVQYWHILSTQSMKAIASNAPTTVDELTTLGVLGEKQIEEYGARIVKPIKKYVENNNLEDIISQNRPHKRPKRNMQGVAKLIAESKPKPHVIAINDDDENEFDDSIFDNVDLSNVP